MTAEPIPEIEQRSVPAWLIPPLDGFTAEQFLTMDGLPPHTELIDGSLVFVSPQRDFHGLTLFVLETGLRRTVPEQLRSACLSISTSTSLRSPGCSTAGLVICATEG